MIQNLSFITSQDPVKDIIDKHFEFKKTFEDAVRPIKVDGIEVGLINPVDLIETKKLKQMITAEHATSEHVFDIFRLEIEIWENFVHQISHFEPQEFKNY